MKVIAVVMLFFVATACSNNNAYYQDIIRLRANKNYHFLNPQQTILDTALLKHFNGLAYFEPDVQYRVDALFTPSLNQMSFAMPHTQNRSYNYYPAGVITFNISEKKMQLQAYVQQITKSDSLNLFIPFADLTNGNHTYSGGRYLDITIGKTQTQFTLDFNMAYNPYCVYNKTYSCPITPKENSLPIAIEAGEKMFAVSK